MKNKKKIIILIIAIILILIATAVTLFLLKKNKNVAYEEFYQYLSQNKKIIDILEFPEYQNLKNELKDKQYIIEGNLNFNFKNNEIEETNLINNLQIAVEGKVDNIEKLKQAKLTLKNQEENIFSVQGIQDNDVFGVISDQVVNKYLVIKNNNLQSLYKKAGLQNANNLPNEIKDISDITVSKDSINTIASKYLNTFVNLTQKENYTVQKNVSMQLDNNIYDKNLDIYTLKLSGEEVSNSLKEILKQIKDDNEALNMILELSKQDKTIDNLNNLRDEIQNQINKLESIENIQQLELKIDLYTSQEQLLKTVVQIGDMKFSIKTENENKIIIETENIENIIYNKYELLKENDTITLTMYDKNNKQNKLEIVYGQNREENINQKIDITINNDGKNYIISYEQTIKLDNNLQIEKIDTNNNGVMLSEYQEADLQALLQAITQRLQQVFNEIEPKTGIIGFYKKITNNNQNEELTQENLEQNLEINTQESETQNVQLNEEQNTINNSLQNETLSDSIL